MTVLCKNCQTNLCSACVGVLVDESGELPCRCPNPLHNSSRRVRSFTDEIPEVQKVTITGGHLVNVPERTTEHDAEFWMAVAESLHAKLNVAKSANLQGREKRIRLERKVEKLERKLGSDE